VASLVRGLKFLQTYFQHLKPQYGEAAALRVALPDAFPGKQISLLTLQYLVEKLLKANQYTQNDIDLSGSQNRQVDVHIKRLTYAYFNLMTGFSL